jgi:uncharacterized membrane protein
MPRIYSIRPTWSLKGRRFQGVRGFTGKPFHPPLTDFPIVCYTLAALFDLISYVSSSVYAVGLQRPGVVTVPPGSRARDFFVAATFVMVAGFIVSLGAVTTGFWDWWKGIPRDHSTGWLGRAKHTQAWRTINWHATVMVTVVVLTLIDLVLRIPNFELSQTQLSWLVLSLLSAAGVLFGAAYGGTLVFEYGFNVENVGEVWEESEQDHVRLPKDGGS